VSVGVPTPPKCHITLLQQASSPAANNEDATCCQNSYPSALLVAPSRLHGFNLGNICTLLHSMTACVIAPLHFSTVHRARVRACAHARVCIRVSVSACVRACVCGWKRGYTNHAPCDPHSHLLSSWHHKPNIANKRASGGRRSWTQSPLLVTAAVTCTPRRYGAVRVVIKTFTYRLHRFHQEITPRHDAQPFGPRGPAACRWRGSPHGRLRAGSRFRPREGVPWQPDSGA
jgi:hypothetical protein